MRTSTPLALTSAALLSFALPTGSSLAESPVQSYALVVGSNRGGEGQHPLTYAERDAERVAALLAELGRTPRDHIERLSNPTPTAIEGALARLRVKLTEHARRGEDAQLLFYYSGHARASGLSLGAEELALGSLRTALRSLPSTLTVVVLDACQSGAFSGVKGASPAADFSTNSIARLQSSGIAVLASSTGDELSQESSELGSSYFTHHLLVGLRGAGDFDRNGRVSLDEAYHYAYQHTLSDTARTQVGSQHATLETDLTGRGDVPLSYPIDADAQLAFPADLHGRIMVQQANEGAVVAELVKAAGAQLLLALPSGSYQVLVRQGERAQACDVSLSRGTVQPLVHDQCAEIELVEERAKIADHDDGGRQARRESWFLEAGAAYFVHRSEDAYVDQLERFGYRGGGDPYGVTVTAGAALTEALSLVLNFSDLGEEWGTSIAESIRWRSFATSFGVRARHVFRGGFFSLFAEGSAGVTLTKREWWHTVQTANSYYSGDIERRRGLGIALRASAGLTANVSPHLGLLVAGGYTYAPSLRNRFDDTHNTGGAFVMAGLRVHGVKGWW